MRRIAGIALFACLSLSGTGARAGWLDGLFDGSSRDAIPPAGEAPQPAEGEAVDQRYWVVLPASGAGERGAIADSGVSIEEVGSGRVGGVADKRSLERLKARGIEPLERTPLEQSHPNGFPQPDSAFHDYAETEAALSAIAAAHPKLAFVFSVGTSLQGRDILAIRFNTEASGTQPSRKPGVVFMGTHHAREHLSTEVPLLLAQWLAANKDRADVRALLAARDVYFIPLVNPDGSEYDHSNCRPDGSARSCSYKWQRKNMRKNSDGSIGVDLNRNYGYQWDTGGASDDPGSETYHGPAPFSEPETQAIRRFIEDRPNLKGMISYHSFSELILYPWGHTDEPIADGKALAAYKAMGRKFAGMTGYTAQSAADLYIASGDTVDWAWGAKGVFSFTFELTPRSSWEGGFYPGAKAIDPTFQKNIGPMLYFLEIADDPYRAADSAAPGAKRRTRQTSAL